MGELVEQITSLAWWGSVVVAGILVSLLAAYIKSWLDRWMGSVSAKARRRNDQIAAERQRQVSRLRASQHEQLMTMHSATLTHLQVLSAELMALLVFVMGAFARPHSTVTSHALLFVGVVASLVALLIKLETQKTLRLLYEARAPAESGSSAAESTPSSPETTSGGPTMTTKNYRQGSGTSEYPNAAALVEHDTVGGHTTMGDDEQRL